MADSSQALANAFPDDEDQVVGEGSRASVVVERGSSDGKETSSLVVEEAAFRSKRKRSEEELVESRTSEQKRGVKRPLLDRSMVESGSRMQIQDDRKRSVSTDMDQDSPPLPRPSTSHIALDESNPSLRHPAAPKSLIISGQVAQTEEITSMESQPSGHETSPRATVPLAVATDSTPTSAVSPLNRPATHYRGFPLIVARKQRRPCRRCAQLAKSCDNSSDCFACRKSKKRCLPDV